MDKKQQFSAANEQWQQDDAQWSKEIEYWQKESRQWSAFLYMLDKNIPEHTSALSKHKDEIQAHEAVLTRFRCGLDDNCLKTCPDHLSEGELEKGYDSLEQQHLQIKHTHTKLKTEFEEQRAVLKKLAERLLTALSE